MAFPGCGMIRGIPALANGSPIKAYGDTCGVTNLLWEATDRLQSTGARLAYKAGFWQGRRPLVSG